MTDQTSQEPIETPSSPTYVATYRKGGSTETTEKDFKATSEGLAWNQASLDTPDGYALVSVKRKGAAPSMTPAQAEAMSQSAETDATETPADPQSPVVPAQPEGDTLPSDGAAAAEADSTGSAGQ